MKKLIIALIIIFSAASAVIAQNEVDALRFSRLQYGGSARYWGLGGAYGAVGADFSSVSTNPAGMGLFKRSEVSFTPTFLGTKVSAKYNGSNADDSKSSLNLGNLGIVFVFPESKSSNGWKNSQFGFGYNRLATYNANYLIRGRNPSTSLLTQYVDWANGTAPGNLGVQGAYDTQLAFNDSLIFVTNKINNIYSADILGVKPFPGIDQMKSIKTKGYLGETVFAGSGNYQDWLYVGASIGILSLRYEETSNLTETDNGNKVPIFNSLNKYDYQLIRGTGYNLKLGVIVRATDWLRLGAALHTPAFYSKLNYDYNTNMSATFDNGFVPTPSKSPQWVDNFDLTTPLKTILSAAFVIGKSGLISADYEMLNYSKALLQPSDVFVNTNQRIQDKYKNTGNLRIGGEYRFGQISLRGGYGMFGSPYKANINDGKGTLVSLGLGYRTADYFVDCAYTSYSMTENYYLYGIDIANSASLKTTNNMFMVSFGLKF